MRFQVFSTVFVTLILFANSNLGISQCLQDQKELLLELRNNLTYDSSLSTKLVQWNESRDCCQWNGVKCDVKGRVSSLDLSREWISSGINDYSSSLFKLVSLQNLNLAQNSLDSVEFPPGFGQLTELRYLNMSDSGFSGQIPLDFSNLTRLVVLDLSSTFYLSLKLENPDLGRLIHNFTRLRELYLDGVNISAKGNDWCNALSSSVPDLRVLSLSNAYLTGPFDSSLAKLRSLFVIRLDDNTFSTPFPEFFADFSNLQVLTISSCNLFGVAPAKLFQIKSLETVDLSNNRELEGTLPEFPLDGSLQNLLLSYTKYSGNVSESIGRLKMLSSLDLRACSFSGPIPSSIKSLTRLVYFDLSMNQFVGPVPSFAFLKNLTIINLHGNGLNGKIPDSLWEGLENLDFLDLSENLLEGNIPSSLFLLPSLKVIVLSNNSFHGSIRDSLNGSSSSLEGLELNINNLEGPIPQFFFNLQNLSTLNLASNKFNGSVELTHLQKLTNLVSLDLSHNMLSLHVDEKVPISSLFPRLGSLMLASCKLQKIPLLKNHTSLMMLDLSDNQLDGEIPNWIWEVGNGFLRFVNLSNNQFIRLQQPYDLRSPHYLDLHSNLLRGQIPLPPPIAVFIDFSNNNLSSFLPENIGDFLRSARFFSIATNRISGTIPSSLCNASNLKILDFSNNTFHGKIPSCLPQKSLGILNLRRNNLSSDIPDTFPVGCTLETLDLSWNFLQGKVPKSLERCTETEIINLSNNDLNDSFPCWFKNLTKLRVLVLSFNKFHGNISCLREISNNWPNLQIINIASNNFNGVLPVTLFRNLKAMTADENSPQSQLNHLSYFSAENGIYYQDSVTVTMKGQELQLEKILTIFTSIDFSNNHFQGIIPKTIGEMKSLYVLNFSRNALSGHIPSSIGNLQKLESLDLSFNNLSGQIPEQIASLTFLSFLNLSYNHLVGRIPHGSQMQTFTESSYIGNDGLCGFPLNKTCSNSEAPAGMLPRRDQESEEEENSMDNEIYASAAMGFLVGLAVIFAPLLFCKRWRRRYNKKLNRFTSWVLGRQYHKLENEDW